MYPKDFAKILKTDDTFSTESDKFRHKREKFMFFVKKTLKRKIKKDVQKSCLRTPEFL